jgi:aconitate decarboxylase
VARLSSGRAAEGACDGPPGVWGRPAPPERLEAKARDCFAHAGYGSPNDLVAHWRAVACADPHGLREQVAALGCEAGPAER